MDLLRVGPPKGRLRRPQPCRPLRGWGGSRPTRFNGQVRERFLVGVRSAEIADDPRRPLAMPLPASDRHHDRQGKYAQATMNVSFDRG